MSASVACRRDASYLLCEREPLAAESSRSLARIVNTLSIHARSARLAMLAAIRHAGYSPWLLVVGWGLFAALQEPLLFRAFGIRLPLQAAWPAVLALVALLVASSPRPAKELSQVIAMKGLVIISSACLGLALAAIEVLRGPADGLGRVAAWLGSCILVATPFALALLAARVAYGVARAAIVVAACVLAGTLAVRFDAEPWSLRALAATLCAWVAAMSLASRPNRPHAHRHPR